MQSHNQSNSLSAESIRTFNYGIYEGGACVFLKCIFLVVLINSVALSEFSF